VAGLDGRQHKLGSMVLATLLRLLLCAATAGATVAAAADTADEAAAMQAMAEAFNKAAASGHDMARCAQTLAPIEALALARVHDDRAAWALQHLDNCRIWLLGQQTDAATTVPPFAAALLETSRRAGHPVGPRMRLQLSAWHQLEQRIGPAAADAWMDGALLVPLLPRARAGDPDAVEELVHLAEAYYGHGMPPARTETLRQRYISELGADAGPSLVMARVQSVTHRRAGRPDQAWALIDPAYQLARQSLPGSDILAWLDSERALVLDKLGRLQEAIEAQQRVAAHWSARQPRNRMRGARAEYNLASLQLAIGRFDAALVHAERAEQWAADAGPLQRQLWMENITARLARAIALLRLGAPDGLAKLRQLLEEEGTPSDYFQMSVPLEELLLAAEQRGDAASTDWARQALQRHLAHWAKPLQTERLLGQLLHARLVPAEAAQARWRAVALGSMGRGPALDALALFETAAALAAKEPQGAVALYKRGSQALHQARADVPSAALLRASLARFEPHLRLFIALLLDQGRLGEADQALAFLQEEEFGELGRRQAALSGPPSFTPAEQRWSRTLDTIGEALLQQARSLERQIDDLAPMYYPGHVQLAEADEAVASAAQAIAAASARLAQEARAAGRIGWATAGPAHGQAQLSYIVSEQQTDALLRLPNGRQHRLRLAVPRAQLARQVQQFRHALERPDSTLADVQAQARRLHRLLMAPVLAALPRSVRQLNLRSDGVLRYLPFAALFDGRRYLAEQLVLSQLGPAPRQASTANKGAPLGLGRVLADSQNPALPAVARELQALGRWPDARLRLDAAFSAAALRAGLAERPAVVHLASHFHLDPGGESASYLLLGDDSRLSLAELARLPWQGVRLALLSGCQTGLLSDGQQERSSLAATLRHAGVQQVLATQWRISDAAAADWISAFYAGIAGLDLRQARPEPAWLAQAQQRWLVANKGGERSHPHYWAAYAWFQ